jgi:hypothetical protein
MSEKVNASDLADWLREQDEVKEVVLLNPCVEIRFKTSCSGLNNIGEMITKNKAWVVTGVDFKNHTITLAPLGYNYPSAWTNHGGSE